MKNLCESKTMTSCHKTQPFKPLEEWRRKERIEKSQASLTVVYAMYDDNVSSLIRHKCVYANHTKETNHNLGQCQRVIDLQHFGRSDGGGISFCSGNGPSLTTHAIFNPQVVCTSRWQCMNQTPATTFFKKQRTNRVQFYLLIASRYTHRDYPRRT